MKIHIKNELGKIGEQIAVEYLEKNGYKILERNFYCKQGEIDIIAKQKQEIIFIEVKTRSNINFGKPSEAVNYKKQKHIYRTAQYYLYKINSLEMLSRFDVIEILIKDGKFNINHIKQII
ncbi:MAG: YraN family protein [Clostridia bacterium]|nr:YraN family protein [Clostridia bacterium]